MKKFKKTKKRFGLSERGQSGAVFRLLVDSIVGIAILMVILGSLMYFESLNNNASRQEFLSKVNAAVNSPDGTIVESNGRIVFPSGSGFTTGDMSALTGYPKECFSFQSNLRMAEANDAIVTFNSNVKTKVYIRCIAEDNGCTAEDEHNMGCCKITCLISFGEPIIIVE
ncbi:MAG: hypothetical protein HOE11_03300 [Candidatus Diapherotrites archaeon]|nr:hypothetical protein [Candidatus Diapherotrites archaeon]MBT4596924.1 hypothetical protein [Candidatus Diapherotrites archaeon]